MAYLNTLRRVINASLIEDGNILKRQSGCADIEFIGDIFLMKSDCNEIHTNVLGTLFNDVAGYHKKNDWVVFAENKVLICEMKTETLEGYDNQLRNGHQLVKYILNKLDVNEGADKPSKSIPIKYVLFSNVADKRTTNGKPHSISNSDGVQWYELSCGSIYNVNDF